LSDQQGGYGGRQDSGDCGDPPAKPVGEEPCRDGQHPGREHEGTVDHPDLGRAGPQRCGEQRQHRDAQIGAEKGGEP